MLVWPSVAALGFAALTGVVIALGTRSTARYELEGARARRAAQQQPSAAPVPAGRPPVGGAAALPGQPGPPTPPPPAHAPAPTGELQQAAVGVLADPGQAASAGTRRTAAGWWLVTGPGDGDPDGGAVRVVAGPFGDRTAADWAALAGGLPAAAGARAVHGVRRPDGALVPRPSPQEQEWLAELGDQMERLAADWDTQVSDADPLTTLVAEVAAALVDAGLQLHDCDGPGSAGGVCLTPEPGLHGILVS